MRRRKRLREDGADGAFIHADHPGNGGIGGFEAHLADITDQSDGHLSGCVNVKEWVREGPLTISAVITLADDLHPNPFAVYGSIHELRVSHPVLFEIFAPTMGASKRLLDRLGSDVIIVIGFDQTECRVGRKIEDVDHLQ